MPIKFSVGEKVKSSIDAYTVEEVLSQGAFAHATKARSMLRGGPVFLKRYFAPTRTLDWYDGFVQHQQELKRRVTTHVGLSQYCYEFVDFFEGTEGKATKTFHQVFEFVQGGKSLAQYIAELAKEGELSQWDNRVKYATVMMMGISALHEQKIVHTDLKPDNLLLIPNTVRTSEYNLKIIDLDWSIFSDQRAPWHGKTDAGYVGTPGYMSPEHLTGAIPVEASDTYTCALMLAELLTGEHPFAGKRGDAEALKKAVLSGDHKPFKLAKPINKVGNPAYLETLINRAMSPNINDRPTSADIKNAFFGKGDAKDPPAPTNAPTPAPTPTPTLPAPPPPTPAPTTPKPEPSKPGSGLELSLDGKVVLKMNIDTVVGKIMLSSVHSDAQFLADAQFRLHRPGGNGWVISPMPGTPNETLLDGQKLDAPTPLRNGMRIGVGRAAKGVEKLPLVVTIK
jgi:serine/threonine protein kinase